MLAAAAAILRRCAVSGLHAAVRRPAGPAGERFSSPRRASPRRLAPMSLPRFGSARHPPPEAAGPGRWRRVLAMTRRHHSRAGRACGLVRAGPPPTGPGPAVARLRLPPVIPPPHTHAVTGPAAS